MKFMRVEQESASFFRRLALEIDQNPSAIDAHLTEAIFERLCLDRSSSCLERTQLIESLSYGDAGVMLASPGPSLAGLMVRELGDEAQKEYFFNNIKMRRCPSFFAVTEPNKGSDAANLTTYLKVLDSKYYSLNGEKCFIGHGADAPIGVLMARSSEGPLGMCAILITPEELKQPEVQRAPLNMLGLRGARLAKMSFHNLRIKKENILGRHLSPMRRGVMAMIKTFNRMRPAVAAFALGHAQAVLDYAREHEDGFLKKSKPILNEMEFEISIIRSLLYSCSKQIDQNPYEDSLASLAKFNAVKIAEKVSIEAIKYFGAHELNHHPLLMKWFRDVFGFEYMEGSSLMHLKNIYKGLSNELSGMRK